MAKRTAFNVGGEANSIVKIIQQLGYKHSSWRVFEDFLQMSAITLSNAVDFLHSEEREKQYMEIVERYSKEELDKFPTMFAHLVNALEEGIDDVLGKIYHALELHNKYKGQFFTPMCVCEMMGKCTLGEHDEIVERQGYITVAEPCCGSGAMVLGFAKGFQEAGYDFQKQMVVTATDIDLKCVHMCYLQLSLWHIPAVVIHGDSLLLKEWSRWYTPAYMLNGWIWRQTCGNLDKKYKDDEIIKTATDPMYAAVQKAKAVLAEPEPSNSPKIDVELKISQNGQMSFF